MTPKPDEQKTALLLISRVDASNIERDLPMHPEQKLSQSASYVASSLELQTLRGFGGVCADILGVCLQPHHPNPRS